MNKQAFSDNLFLRAAAWVLTLGVLTGCGSDAPATPVSTLDSNIEKLEDSPVLDLDNPADSNFSIALDTPGPDVDPEDTVTRNKTDKKQ